MAQQRDFSDELEQMYDENHSQIEKITSRVCSSDDHDGIEYKIYGSWVAVRPLLDFFAEEDGYGIETISHVDDAGSYLCVFVADLGQSEHPALVP